MLNYREISLLKGVNIQPGAAPQTMKMFRGAKPPTGFRVQSYEPGANSEPWSKAPLGN